MYLVYPNRPKEHGSLREDHEPAWIYLSIGGCPPKKLLKSKMKKKKNHGAEPTSRGIQLKKNSHVMFTATFRASDMKAISDFGLHQQMVFAHILTELAPVICSDHEIHVHTSHT